MELTWIVSYETLKFDTPDGDLHKNQYAEVDGKFFIRTTPENNGNFEMVLQSDVKGKAKVNVLPEKAYYNVFELPDGRLLRIPSTEQEYKSLAEKGAKKPRKYLVDTEFFSVYDDDSKWEKVFRKDTEYGKRRK